MPAMISCSIATTPINGTASSIAIAPPPAYAAGNLLVMVVTGGGATAGAAVSATAPSGWTALSSSGAGLSVFYKTATGSEPASYAVTMSATCCIAAYVAAYPAATIASHSFGNSASGVTSYTGTWPSAASSQLVLAPAAAVASAGNAGYQNVVYPSGLTAEIPVFGQALPFQPGTVVYPCAAGLYDVTGSVMSGLPAPQFTSPQPCTAYAGFIVLTLTGTSAPLRVTASVAYPEATPGLLLTVKALTGAAPPAAIIAGGAVAAFSAGGTSQAPQAPVTPNASGSLVYGAATLNLASASAVTFTPGTHTTFSQNASSAGNPGTYGTFRSTAATTAGTPVTLGGTAPVNPYFTVALAEILAAPGSSLSETATAAASGMAPGDFATTAVSQTAVFAVPPAAGSLLVAMVSANSYWPYGSAVVTITDSSGLAWTPLVQQPSLSYSGVWIAQVPAPPSSYVVEDEGGGTVLDEAGGQVYDESGPGSTSLFRQPGHAAKGRPAARKGTVHGSPGAPYVFVPVVVAPFTQPHRAVSGRASARKGTAAAENLGAAYVYVPVIPAAFTQPDRAVPAHPAARHGTTAGSPGAPYAYVPPSHTFVILDEAGSAVLDEAGGQVYDESGPGPAPASPAWSAARAGLNGDESAVNWASQVSQFLTTHGVVPVYGGSRIWTVAQPADTVTTAFAWLDAATPGWLPAAAVSQPFAMPAGATAVGRVQVPVQASGSGADLQVSLCPDNGSGSPNVSSPLASVTVPASHIAALSAAGSLATAGPLATAQCNTALPGTWSPSPWTQPALSANGAGSYATPATSGGFTALVGGYDTTAAAPSASVYVIASQGATVSTGTAQPSLPKAAYLAAAAVTTDSVVVAGGLGAAGALGNAWTASWDPGLGVIGAWSAQQALPAASVNAAMASWGTTVYVIGGSTAGTAATAVSTVLTASASTGQISAWTAGPPLPVKTFAPYAAVVGSWLVVAGGQSTAGAAQTAVWYSAVNADGSLAGWQQGPSLPQPAYAYGPSWNLAVTDSAVMIVGGPTTGGANSPYTQVLAVSPDGPAAAWQLSNWDGGEFQAAAYPAAGPGQWQLFSLHTTTFATGLLYPVPLLSVPLPVSGLTPGATYHVVLRQSGGSAVNSLALGAMASGTGAGWLWQPRSGGTWTPAPGQQVAVNVFDQTAGGNPLHLVQDSGAGVTTLTYQGAGGLLNGVLESTVFPPGSPEAVLPSVVQVTYGTGGVPTGLVQLD